MTPVNAALNELLGADWQDQVATRRSEIAQRVSRRSRVLLFGAGYLGRHALRDLAGLPFNVEAFVDNDESLWGTSADGLEILSPQDAAARFGQDAVWLITVYTNSKVVEQCEALGVPWVTCAEFSWILPEPHSHSFSFGLPETLAGSANDILAAVSLWADEESKAEYMAQVRWRFLLDYSALAPPRPAAETYFPDDLVQPRADEVFVDCGAFTGDTVETFVTACEGRFKAIVAIEPDTLNAQALEARLDKLGQPGCGAVRVERVAAGASRGTLSFSATGTAGSSVGSGENVVEVRPLDEILADSPPTYIKFDVEGAERDALVGASETIRVAMPVLAVCLYHKPEDLWDLPLLIHTLGPEYRLYLRRYSDERWETVCYAVPESRLKR